MTLSGRRSHDKTTKVGGGAIDWTRIFDAAKKTKVAGCHIEQEPRFERPPLESARISCDTLHTLNT